MAFQAAMIGTLAPAGRAVALVSLASLWMAHAAAMAAGATPPASACSNFGEVTPGFYRGAEPADGCLEHLADLGVRTVVNLRDDEEASEREEAKVLALGMRYVALPMSGFDRPSEVEVRRVLDVVGGPGNRPVFVHCRRGRDRTGVVVAAHRMVHDGWPVDRAMQEARRFGLAWWQFGMKRFIRDFFADAGRPQDGRP